MIIKKDMDIKAGNRLTSDFVMIQGTTGGVKPSLTVGSPTAGKYKPGDSVTIHGQNMQDIDKVSFMNFPCDIVGQGTHTSTYINIYVPKGTPNSGEAPLVLSSPAGEASTSTTLMITGDGTLDLF